MPSDLSVVIPACNNEKTIVRALDSCLGQTLPPKEIIVVDDASRDGTPKRIDAWRREHGESIKIIFRRLEINRGPSAARNIGWDMSCGKYVAFLDADDYFVSRKIERIVEVLHTANRIVLLAHNHIATDEEYIERQAYPKKIGTGDILIKNRFATPSVTVLQSIEERFDETMRFTEDHDLWLRITQRYDSTYYLDEALTVVNRLVNTRGGQSENLWAMRRGEIKMYKKYCQRQKSMLLFPLFAMFSLGKHTLKMIKG